MDDWQWFVDTGASTWLESLAIKGQAAEIAATAEAERLKAQQAASAEAAAREAANAEGIANREALKFIVAAVVIGVVGWQIAKAA